LLLETPFIGDETEIRNPPPTPILKTANEETVTSWLSPPEKMLRFPVELRTGARLSFRLSAQTRVSVRMGQVVMRVEYAPKTGPAVNKAQGGAPIVIYTTTPEESPIVFQEWAAVDLSLADLAPGKGELRFVVDGELAGNPGLDILWGQPSIYHPDEMRHRNVLLIGVDTLRADALSLYGGRPEVSPFLQEFSAQATTFMQARSQAPWTLPSFASMVTGRLPSEIDATVYTGRLSEKEDTIGEFLLPKGFATSLICSNLWLGHEQSGFQQGMESVWYRYDASAEESALKAVEFINRSKDRDWFCFLHFIDPHVPYHPPYQFVDLLTDPAYDGPYKTYFGAIEDWKTLSVIPTEEDLRQVKDLYDGEVAEVDKAMRSLVDYLARNNLLENTLIIFAADHGEEFYDHGGFEHGHTEFDELVHTPLIVEGPGFTPGGKIDESVGNTDIAPTILRYLSLPVPEDMRGIPLQDVVAGTVPPDRHIYGEGNTRGPLRKFAMEWPWKCILNYVSGNAELYNIQDDPRELTDLADSHRDIVTRLSREIALTMLPSETALHVWITRGFNEGPQKFTGSITIEGGIDKVEGYLLDSGDSYEVNGDTVTFNITSSVVTLGPNKHLKIIPSVGADTFTADLLVNGKVDPERFLPYGVDTRETSGHAEFKISGFPLGPDMPLGLIHIPAACYLWGVKGTDRREGPIQLDEQAKEQLRALGYLQ
jgi:arylsulfatase A-like enzyme